MTPPIVYPIVQAYSAFLTSQGQPPITGPNDPRWVSPSDGAVPYTCILDSVPFVSANFVDNDPLRLSTAINQGDHCRERKADEMFFGSADIEWSLSDAVTIRSLTGYNKGSHIDWGDYGLFGASTNLIHNDNESFSQEFQLTGDTEMFERIASTQVAFNRLVLYPSNALHSADIDREFKFDPDPRTGRFSVNSRIQMRPQGFQPKPWF